MTDIKELRRELRKIAELGCDKEIDHQEADDLLLKYIGDAEVRRLFKSIPKWYA